MKRILNNHASMSMATGRCLLSMVLLCGIATEASSSEAQPMWSVAWITDTQTPDCEWITALVDRLRADEPEMILHTGDTRFEWANQCAWKDVVTLMRSRSPALELHLAPGNHDDANAYVLKPFLARAATEGVYLLDTGQMAEGRGYYHNRVTAETAGDLWPSWNPEVAVHPHWRAGQGPPYRYVFKRGGIRFILCDCYWSKEQQMWLRDLIVQPDDSSVTIVLQHEHTVDKNAGYFAGLEGRHNVKLMLTGHDHNYHKETRHGVTFITGAGVARGPHGENDAMTLQVFENRIRLDRYRIAKDAIGPVVEGPETIWECEGTFTAYDRPESGVHVLQEASATQVASMEIACAPGSNLVFNGNFDNGIWYERYRGWSPSGWYQWFTCGDDAPEHAVGKDKPHSGKEYVRIHMWAHAWRGGILQNVRDVVPGHWYRLRAYGWFAKTAEDPRPQARVGLDPLGKLREQFGVDVTKHPAPAYNECVGDDPKTEKMDWPDLPDSTEWTDDRDYFDEWGRFEVSAEARSEVVTAILYCDPRQREGDKPIYEMNWDSVSLVEVPWPTKRLVDDGAEVAVSGELSTPVVTVQPELKTVQVTWRSKAPAGAAQVLYRFLDSNAVTNQPESEKAPTTVRTARFPMESPVVYERSTKSHWIEIEGLSIPETAVELQTVGLIRVCVDGECSTHCSPLGRVAIR